LVSIATIGQTAGAAKDISAVDRLVLGTINTPFKRDIDTATLLDCIWRAELGTWPVHVAAFFTDVAPHLILSFAAGHGISRSKLAEAYDVMKTETGERNLNLESELVSVAAFTR
jgi:hypothetical protein